MAGWWTGFSRAGLRAVVLLCLDAALATLALELALGLRFEGAVPAQWTAGLGGTLLLLALIRTACNAAAQLHVWSFRMAGLPDAVRVVIAVACGSAVFAPLVAPGSIRPQLPRSVVALEFFLSASAFSLVRFGPRVFLRWHGGLRKRRAGAVRALVVGASESAELLARDIGRNPESPYEVIGFVGERPDQLGGRLDGRPVLGLLPDLPELILLHEVELVLLALARHPPARLREVISVCANSRVRFKIAPEWSSSREVSAALLDDVAPEDLLARPAVLFDEQEIRGLVAGRRALVTGAGGSIGSEVCRQLVRYGVAQLVMVDMNENELYLSARALARERPDVEIRAEVADVRDAERVGRLGALYRPECVIHAAAHKHVPLMEDAPDEAVKNNVFGTLNVARMADACGAWRFILISTDKAVNPSSVMGATKRIAEMVVRDLARTSQTRMSAVRFGNVLGSAGSVVPLFKQQIARGGPVTVTHPDCTRYFMTIPEAVGLVLLSGLGDYGELCILDMGEPIRIDDLARIMISLAGRVPGVDIEVVYTGLRPGEKLAEELLTEEEEQSHAVRDRIRIARSNALPGDLPLRLAELRRRAEEGDAEGIRRSLRALVPTYRPARAPALPRPRRAPEVVEPVEPAQAPLGAAGVSASPA